MPPSRVTHILLLVTLGFGLSLPAAAAPEVCIEYAKTIAAERRVNFGYESVDAWAYQHECGIESRSSRSQEALDIGIPDIISADGSGSRAKRKSKQWCDENSHLKDATQVAYSYQDSVVLPALEVLKRALHQVVWIRMGCSTSGVMSSPPRW